MFSSLISAANNNVRVQIIGGRLYIQKVKWSDYRLDAFKYIIYKILQQMQLEDVEFILNIHDGCVVPVGMYAILMLIYAYVIIADKSQFLCFHFMAGKIFMILCYRTPVISIGYFGILRCVALF